ncbi:hypothetical protein C8R43DRAFT_1120669 [Mycena crocata]|nr:hypothetical protein C8R43DRAFT_1120669 [Mycena crocata]
MYDLAPISEAHERYEIDDFQKRHPLRTHLRAALHPQSFLFVQFSTAYMLVLTTMTNNGGLILSSSARW